MCCRYAYNYNNNYGQYQWKSIIIINMLHGDKTDNYNVTDK